MRHLWLLRFVWFPVAGASVQKSSIEASRVPRFIPARPRHSRAMWKATRVEDDPSFAPLEAFTGIKKQLTVHAAHAIL